MGVDPDYKPLSHSCIALLLKLVDSNALCNSALCHLIDNKEANFSDLHYLLLANNEFLPFLKKMLRSNMAYRKFVIMATDMSLLLGPVLKDLYSSGDQDSDELGEKFELLQIMCKDDLFNQAIHSCSKSGSFAWYKEKALKNTKLGGMLILILLRSILQNKNDTIFQKTCMNILVDMSVQISLLDLYPSERLVACLEILLKKHSRLVLSSETLDANNIEDLVKNLIVIISNALINQNNPNLVYSLLYKREILTSYTKQTDEFVEHFQNVNNLLDHVSQKIEELNDDSNSIIDTSYLLSIIQAAILEYPKEEFSSLKTNKDISEPTVELVMEQIESKVLDDQSKESDNDEIEKVTIEHVTNESTSTIAETKHSEIDNKEYEEKATKTGDEIKETDSIVDTLKEKEVSPEESDVKQEIMNNVVTDNVVSESTVELTIEEIGTEAVSDQSEKMADSEVEKVIIEHVVNESNTAEVDAIKSGIEKDVKENTTETGDEISTTDDTLNETDMAPEDCVQDKETINEEIEESVVEDVSGEKSSNAPEEVIAPNEPTTNIAAMENVESVAIIIPEQDQQSKLKELKEVENSAKEVCRNKSSELLNEDAGKGTDNDANKPELLTESKVETPLNEVDQEGQVIEPSHVEPLGTDPCDEVDNNAEANADIAANKEEADSNELATDTDETNPAVVDNKDSRASEEEEHKTREDIAEEEETNTTQITTEESCEPTRDEISEIHTDQNTIVKPLVTDKDETKPVDGDNKDSSTSEEEEQKTCEDVAEEEETNATQITTEESCEPTREEISEIHTDQNTIVQPDQFAKDISEETKSVTIVSNEDEMINSSGVEGAKEEEDEKSRENMPEEIPLENIKEPVRNGESSDAIVNQTEENVNFEGSNEIPDEIVNNSTDDQVELVATETSSVAIQNETVSSEDNEIAETKSIDENDLELESNETANEVPSNDNSQVDSEVILEGSTNLENESHQHEEKNENDEDTTDIESQESESSTLVEFEAFNKEDKSPVTFLIDSKMLEKLLIGSKSKIVITDFEILSNGPVRNKSGDSGIISQDEEADEKQNTADAAIYKEFADQQRKINFAQIHNEKEKPATKPAPSGEAMSTNLFLAGSNIKFDLDEKLKIIGTAVSPSANVIWKRAGAVGI